MAISNNCVKFLAYAKNNGVSFQEMLTLGRMNSYAEKKFIRQLAKNHNAFVKPITAVDTNWEYAEPIFELLGAKNLKSLDYSSYENADITQDLNLPWPAAYNNSFSAIFDGGTLEHVFNFPVAIKSCMKALQIGGHFIAITPANNQNGHGFYQFSPELYFRIFSEENGFQIKTIILTPNDKNWYEITDPHNAKSRVLFTNSVLTRLMVIAEKISDKEIFLNSPYQSDYSEIWTSANTQVRSKNTGKRNILKLLYQNMLPARLKNWLRNIFDLLKGKKIYTRDMGFINPNHFKKINW